MAEKRVSIDYGELIKELVVTDPFDIDLDNYDYSYLYGQKNSNGNNITRTTTKKIKMVVVISDTRGSSIALSNGKIINTMSDSMITAISDYSYTHKILSYGSAYSILVVTEK